MNPDAFRAVADAIMTWADRFNLANWGQDLEEQRRIDGSSHTTMTSDEFDAYYDRFVYSGVASFADMVSQECSTTACIAGWRNLLSERTVTKHGRTRIDWDNTVAAAADLGITEAQAYRLFWIDATAEPSIWKVVVEEQGDVLSSYQQITPELAAKTMHRIADGDLIL